MLRLLNPAPGRLCDRIDRRELLQIGGLGLMGLTLPGLFRAEAAAGSSHPPQRAKRCIMITLTGGPSHLDMWDMKPDAPEAIRGEFKPIATSAPGIQLSEHLPKLAKQAHHCAIVRSLHHKIWNAHAAAAYTTQTGHDKGDTNVVSGSIQADYPGIGAVLTQVYGPETAMSPYVSLPYVTYEGAKGPPQRGLYGGWLGKAYDPHFLLKDPNKADFRIDELTPPSGFGAGRFKMRRNLLKSVNKHLDDVLRTNELKGLDSYQQRALNMISSPEVRRAFDISQEDAKRREAYGRNIYGQSILLSRRLLEAGCRMVAHQWGPDANATWDTHGSNFAKLKGTLLPQLDAALSSLIADLDERGMLDETLIICMGEFGRTPKINKSNGGRDHWPYCYSALLAGGGIRGGIVYGSSDETGAAPADNPTTPQDLLATVYHLLGIDPGLMLIDPFNRPLRIIETPGQVIQGII